MGRPLKTSIDYFQHDSDMSGDYKIEALEGRHGLVGYAVFVKLLERIYRNGGSLELEPDGAVAVSTAKRFGIDQAEMLDIIGSCVSFGLFEAAPWQQEFRLTSARIRDQVELVNRMRDGYKSRKSTPDEDTTDPCEDIPPENPTQGDDISRENPTPDTDITRERCTKERRGEERKGEREERPPKRAKKDTLKDPLEEDIRESFNGQNLTSDGKPFYANWAKEMKAIKTLATLIREKWPGKEEQAARALLTRFLKLVKGVGRQDRFYLGKAFLPSFLASGGIFPQVAAMMDNELMPAEHFEDVPI